MTPPMGRPGPPQPRVRAPHRLLWPVTAAAGAALVAGTVQPPPSAQTRPDTVPVASVTCSTGVWKADYYPNTTLTGTPRKSLCDASLSRGQARPRTNEAAGAKSVGRTGHQRLAESSADCSDRR